MAPDSSPPKVHWHPCSLQQLTPRELTSVINAILQGDLHLLPLTPDNYEDASPKPLDKGAKRAEAVRRHLESFNGVERDPESREAD